MRLPPTLESGSHSAPRVGVRVGDRLLSAMPVHLDGHRASLRLDDSRLLEGWMQTSALADAPTHLHLDWADGRVTELAIQVRSTDMPAQVAHMEIRGVDGDWRPFMEYLALRA